MGVVLALSTCLVASAARGERPAGAAGLAEPAGRMGPVFDQRRSGPTDPPDDFVRGDATGDGGVDLSDVLSIVVDIFPLSGFPPTIDCEDAADVNDDGALGLADVYLLLSYLFGPGAPPTSPFPSCGPDPTPDGLGCDDSTICP